MATPQNLQSDATRIIAAIEDRIDRTYKNNSKVEMTWGTVAGIASSQKLCSAYLYGDSAYASEDFRVPETMYLNIGDVIKVAMHYETGERWVEEVYFPAGAYKKIAIDLKTGSLLQGDGTVPPSVPVMAITGEIKMWPTVTPPTGYLICNGAAISRATYASLFGLIGTTFGVGDGSTTFNVPDFRQRFPIGVAASGTGSTLAGTGGTVDHQHSQPTHTHTGPSHTHTGPSHTHTTDAHTHTTPVHSHGGTTDVHTATLQAAGSGNTRDASHSHTFTTNTDGNGTTGSGAGGSTSAAGTGATGADGTGVTSASGNDDTGTGNPPFLAINFIIKT